MKKIMISIFAIAAISVSANATAKHALFIPSAVTSSFDEIFPDVNNVTWQPDNEYLKAVFVKDNASENAYFTIDGNLAGTTKAVSFEDLPASAQKTITEKYKNYKFSEAIFFTDNDAENESDLFEIPDIQANYFVSMQNDKKSIILQVGKDGETSFYKEKNL